MIKRLSQRFHELNQQLNVVEATVNAGTGNKIDEEMFLGWKVKTKNLLTNACGEKSQHFQSFLKAEIPQPMESSYYILKRVGAVFLAAKEDFEGGYLASLKSLVQAEVFESELEQASELLRSGYKLASAVIAGVVLETALRDLCSTHGLPIGKLDTMNGQLAKAGVYNKLQQKRITAIADIRNSAAHGKPEEFTDLDVENMIQDIEGVLLSYLA
ncbi:DUF4145 domain-containing protein [Cellvibrio sp. KY-GH-1]|uniref:DUF4145 domain-containing protein n=1 Tax=Cellvibrio sp. KY-GH-1 TaxID=2303332 RepID=UPI0012473D6B|nr:DUF4145 domain-containing protein [Cellvibrio sp. KY-GH-1]QEY16953.1 DUF4145 domain-containing protein [Cellvibrio sp. KY-GH-1]